MTTYHKIWGISFILILTVILGSLFYGVKSSDRSYKVLDTTKQLDSNIVSKILIEPKNIEWGTSLTLDTIIIRDKKGISDISNYLKIISPAYPGKGYKTIWDCRLKFIFNSPNKINLKNKDSLTLDLFNTPKGLFFELPNTTGYQFYNCDGLSKYLEEAVGFNEHIGENTK